jgi:hypothetical protein
MKKSYVASISAALVLSAWGISSAAEMAKDTTSKPGVVEAAAASMTGTVTAIDYKTRMVTLKSSEGKEATMEVGPEAVRFNEVKKGDKIKIDYLESVAVMVTNPHDTVGSGEAPGTLFVRNKTAKPSAVAVHTRVVTATVEKINAKKRTAVLKGPDGNEFPIDIAPDVQHLENVKKGDQVVVKYTTSVGITVSKP